MIHRGGGLPVPWLLEQPEHVIIELYRRTTALLDEAEDDA